MFDSDVLHHVDARLTLCPMPVIRTQQCVRQLEPGARVRVVASDPGALHDIPAWCRIHGHTVLSSEQDGNDFVVLLKTGAADMAHQ